MRLASSVAPPGKAVRVTLINLWPKGGMLHYTSQLANALARQPAVCVTVVLPRGTNTDLFNDDVRREFVDVLTSQHLLDVVLSLRHLLNLSGFMDTIDATQPDVVHVNSSHPWFLAVMPRLRRRTAVIATVHDVDVHPGEDTWRKRLERKVVVRGAKHVIVHHERLRQKLLDTMPNLASESVHVTPHGDYGFFRRWAKPAARDTSTVLFFGRIHEYKGLAFLLDAAPKVREHIPQVRFVIAGEGDLGPYSSKLSDTSLFEVHNYYIPDDEVASLFQSATLLALPYIEASESGVLHIAFSLGLPVVATLVGGFPDAIEHGQTGLLVPSRKVEPLTEAIVKLLEDVEARERMARNALAVADAEHGWDDAAQRLVSVYESLTHS
jgi:glycosyltransferase involved in cell wall biosynthesis